MTALTSDELRLKRFMRVRPRHTGLGIAPNTDPGHHWWFPHEAAVERHEEHHACLFCRECQTAEQGGIALAPLLVDYDKDPLKAVVAIAETVCVSCRGYSTYPVTEVFDFGDTTVNIRTYGYPSPASMRDSEAYGEQMQRLAQSNTIGIGLSNHQAPTGNAQSAQNLFNRAIASLKNTP